MNNYYDLQRWVCREMPALDRVLGPMGFSGQCDLLNKVTGQNVAGTELVDASARRFLNALQAMPKEERQEIERKARNGELP